MPAITTRLFHCLTVAFALSSPLISTVFAGTKALHFSHGAGYEPLAESARGQTTSQGNGPGSGPISGQSIGQSIGQSDPPQIPRDLWKDCAYNNTIIRCQDQQQANSLKIVWIDGLRSSFVRKPPSKGLPSYWGDRYGGLWRRELLPQGNTLLTNLATGNRILVPLRYPCKPPLKGEVGYCRY